MQQALSIHSYNKTQPRPEILFWSGLYFFFNAWLLPLGLLYTSLLTPVFVIYLHQQKALRHGIYFFLFLIPFAIIHIWQGVDISAYLVSTTLLCAAFLFALALYQFIKDVRLEPVFKWVLLANFIFLLLAVLLRYTIPATLEIFWYQNKITTGAEESIRFKGLTYEASYYALLFAPIFLYYCLRLMLTPVPHKTWLLLLVLTPLLFSLSFGVMITLLFAIVLALCADAQAFVRAGRYLRWLLILMVAGCVIFILLMRWFPDSAVALRLLNMLQGQDPSFAGRTTDAFYLAWKIAAQKSIWWGGGLGQVKVIGPEIFQQFYGWPSPDFNAAALPNSVADLFAQGGFVAVILKFVLLVYFFFKTATYNNVYRLTLFAFMFVYQFTGSFINNIAEFSIWVLAFSPGLFLHFNRSTGNMIATPKNKLR